MLYTSSSATHDSSTYVCIWPTDPKIDSMPSKPASARLQAFQGIRSDADVALAHLSIVLQRVLEKIASGFPTSKHGTTGAVGLLQTLSVTIRWG